MSTTTDLSVLKINYLTQAQYDAAASAGTIEADEIYLTPAGSGMVEDVTVDGTSVVSSGVAVIDLTGKASASHTHTKSQITDFPSIPSTAADVGAVPTSRKINNKALTSDITLSAADVGALSSSTTIPTITDTYSSTSSDGMSGKAVNSAIGALDGSITGSPGSGKTLTVFSQTDGKVTASFANISIGKSQVSDFPTIPTVYDATLTIQKNGTNVKTFTANASSNVTANITVPSTAADVSAVPTSRTVNGKSLSADITLKFSDLDSKPTTIAGYGITDAKISSGTITLGTSTITPLTSFTETDPTVPSWAKASSKPSYNFSEIGSTPTTLSGYGITDAKIASGVITLGSNTITPLTSFTETDPVFTSSPAYGISATDISNWYNGKLELDTTAASGTTDGDLYAAIVALGWASDVIE